MNIAHISPMMIWMGATFFVMLTLGLVIWRSKHAQQRRQSRYATHVDQQADDPAEMTPSSNIPLAGKLVSIRLMAEAGRPYRGYELLQALLSAGLRYDGRQKIFQRYALPNGRGRILFGMASVQSPGVFEMDTMGGYSCPGLVAFFQSGQSTAATEDYKLMVNTTKQLIDDLGGTLLTSSNEVFDEAAYTETLINLNDTSVLEPTSEEEVA